MASCRAVRVLALILVVASTAVLAACGDDESPDAGGGPAAAPATSDREEANQSQAEANQSQAGKAGAAAGREKGTGPTILAKDSEFGRILVDSDDQAIYIFENDQPGRSTCSGECAAAWPPVLTKDAALAGQGVNRSLLGTTRRGDGATQVTYDDKPLYYYAHEGPGQILCHDVNLNGGYWWVIGPNGERRP